MERIGIQTTQRVFQNINLSRLEFGFGTLNSVFRWKLTDGTFSQVVGNAQARPGLNNSSSFVGQDSDSVGFLLESDGTETEIVPNGFDPLGGVNDQDLMAGELLDSFAAFYFLGSPSAQAVPGISGLGATSLATGVSDTDLIYGDTDSTVFLYDFFEDSLTDLNTLTTSGISDLQRLESIHGVAKGSDIFFGTYTDNNNQVGYYKAVIQETGAGDFDGDGDVDGSDLLVWQRDVGTSSGLAEWRDQYGASTSLSAVKVVPEPTGLGALLLVVAAYGYCRTKGKSFV